MNKKRILKYIQQNQGHSRTEIAKALVISKPTVSNIVDELLTEQWIREEESENASSSGGRKPFHIYFNEDAYYVIGMDIGGTTVELAIMNLVGDIKYHTQFPTQPNVGDSFIETLASNTKRLIEESNLEHTMILGMGIGVPGITNVDKGIVIDAPSIGFENIPLKTQLEKLLPFPVYIDNDVNVAVLGEQWKGEGTSCDTFLMITLGTGVGCGIILDGKLYRGASFSAGEIGYMVTDRRIAESNYEHTFKGYGFLDSHVGGPAIARKMEKQTLATGHSAKEVFEQAIEGNPIALEIVEESLSHLAFSLINVISILNPERIILGGGISKSIHYFLPKLRSTIKKHVPIHADIVVTSVENVSMIGAGYLFLKEYESILKD
ncbi:ROK family transcriptional regulator [Ornithinibacillus halotolerans]|uniref:Glucokinase n=1 Tax=Ornithinibacillus halotolerans TaxID=1274357 RepID=A0A916S3J5_9BACI|nr:ROK family transcriptional regulator [Ornithinibacillus halotolerans]GGA79331.1 glucokinase [Ornithinibacillus halotolerans]